MTADSAALSSSINSSTICFCVEFTKENRKEFVVSNLLDFGADNPPTFLKDALVVPERIELLQCVGCVLDKRLYYYVACTAV